MLLRVASMSDTLTPFNRTSCAADSDFWAEQLSGYELSVTVFAALFVLEAFLVPMTCIVSAVRGDARRRRLELSMRRRGKSPDAEHDERDSKSAGAASAPASARVDSPRVESARSESAPSSEQAAPSQSFASSAASVASSPAPAPSLCRSAR